MEDRYSIVESIVMKPAEVFSTFLRLSRSVPTEKLEAVQADFVWFFYRIFGHLQVLTGQAGTNQSG